MAHIALASDYAREGYLYTYPGNVYSAYPQFMHALYATALFNSGEKTVTLLNWSMALLACGAIYSLGRRIKDHNTGLVAMAILATAPIFMDQAGGIGIDLPFTALTLCALTALAAWYDEKHRGWLILAALLAGSSCGIRHTGYITCLLLSAGVLIITPQQRIRQTATFACFGFAAALPWLIRSYWNTGNPFFPINPGGLFDATAIPHIGVASVGGHETINKTGGMNFLTFLKFPWDIVMQPAQYDGWTKSPGGLILALGVPGLVLGGKRAWSLGTFSITGGAILFFFQRFARYLLPFFAPMMVLAALSLGAFQRGNRLLQIIVAASFLFGLGLHIAAVHFKVPVVLGRTTAATYLENRVERYPAFTYLNENCNDGGVTFTIDQRSYYIDGPTYQNHWGMKALAQMDKTEQHQWLKDQHIRYILWPEEYLQSSGAIRDLEPMLNAWLRDTDHFEQVTRLALPNPKGAGVDHVTILRFLPEEP